MANAVYPDLDNQFPVDIDNFDRFLDPTISTKSAIEQYYSCINNNDFTGASQVLKDNPLLNRMIINANTMNKLRDAIISVQRYYFDDIRQYIVDLVVYQGEWNTKTRYSKYNVVYYVTNNVTEYYIAIKDVKLGTIPTNTSYWVKLTLRGEKGDKGSGMIPKGIWQKDANYQTDDLVSYNNCIWGAAMSNTNEEPNSSSKVWYLIMDVSNCFSSDLIIPIPVSSWFQSGEGYKCSINVPDMKSTTNPVYGLATSNSSMATDELLAYNKITNLITDDGSITLYANEKPETNFSIVLKGFINKADGVTINEISDLAQKSNEAIDSVNAIKTKVDGDKLTYSKYLNDGKLPINFYNGGAVLFNNELHILGGTSSPTSHYKYSNGKWISVGSLPVSFIGGGAVVYDDELHIVGGQNNTKHYKWNGSVWSVVDTMPTTAYPCSVCLFEDAIHVFTGNKHFNWNGFEWSSVSAIPITINRDVAVPFKGEIHIISGNKHYGFNGSEWDYKGLAPFNCVNGNGVVLDEYLHIFGGTSNPKAHYFYTGSSWHKDVNLQAQFANGNVVCLGDDIYVLGSSYTPTLEYVLEYQRTGLVDKVNDIFSRLDGISFSVTDDGILQITYEDEN